MHMNREPGEPPNKLSLPLGDMGGSIFSMFGILAALHERNQTGSGRLVEIAMLDSMIAMLGLSFADVLCIWRKPSTSRIPPSKYCALWFLSNV